MSSLCKNECIQRETCSGSGKELSTRRRSLGQYQSGRTAQFLEERWARILELMARSMGQIEDAGPSCWLWNRVEICCELKVDCKDFGV